MSGLVGSMRIWLKYIGRWFSFDTKVHERPLSFERHTPESCAFGGGAAAFPPRPPRPPRPPPAGSPAATTLACGGSLSCATSICAYITLGFDREMSSAMRPSVPCGKPAAVTRFHDRPPSVL